MKAKKLLIATLFTSVAAVAVGAFAFAAPKFESDRLRATGGYGCSGINLGMVGSNPLRGYITTSTAGQFTVAGSPYSNPELGVVSGSEGLSITSASFTNATAYWLKSGVETTIDGKKYTATHNQSLKIGKKEGSYGAMTLTFNKEIVGCDIYIAAWNEPAKSGDVTLTVNGGTATVLTKNSDITGNIVPDVEADFVKYHYDFEARSTLEISVRNRAYISDIAVRVAK